MNKGWVEGGEDRMAAETEVKKHSGVDGGVNGSWEAGVTCLWAIN